MRYTIQTDWIDYCFWWGGDRDGQKIACTLEVDQWENELEVLNRKKIKRKTNNQGKARPEEKKQPQRYKGIVSEGAIKKMGIEEILANVQKRYH